MNNIFKNPYNKEFKTKKNPSIQMNILKLELLMTKVEYGKK